MSDNRRYFIQIFILLVGILYLGKLFYIQVVDSTYELAAENNTMQAIVEYPYRGIIFDRNGQILAYNQPVFDILVIPKEVEITDTLAFCNAFNVDREFMDKKLKEARKYSYSKPSVFLKMLSMEDFGKFQDLLVDFPGFIIQARTLRGYSHTSLSHALGYIAEIDANMLKKDTSNYYRQGDYIGISGLESSYEQELRGKKGVHFKMVNVRGEIKGDFRDGKHDSLSVPGQSLFSTIDLDLQKYGEKLMEGKAGAIVALEPKTGEVLSLVSSPFYDPNKLSGRQFGDNFKALTLDSLTPLYNRAIQSVYPPGSTFKPLQALIAMQENVLTPNEQIFCSGGLVGDHAPPGYYDVYKAIEKSSNNYFYIVFKRIINQNLDPSTFVDSHMGLEKWSSYLDKFGLGRTVGIDIPNEKGGKIPTPGFYDRVYGDYRWKWSTINSISIGQGEILISPLQMANYSAIIANKGYFYTPHFIRGIGEDGSPHAEFLAKNEVGIDAQHFDPVIDAMEQVVSVGTGFRARMDDIVVCGKTGTSQNPHGEDHSVFVAFAPKEDPQIAVSVYVQNAGQGARAAASIAGLMIEKYLKGEVKRKWIEDYALRGEFIY